MSTNRVPGRSARNSSRSCARPLPKMDGREGAMFTIYWGEVSADSDGPVEMCKPVPAEEAKALTSHYPDLSLRTEPAHARRTSPSRTTHYRLVREGPGSAV